MRSASDPFMGAGSPRKSVTGPLAMRVPISVAKPRQASLVFCREISGFPVHSKAFCEALHAPLSLRFNLHSYFPGGGTDMIHRPLKWCGAGRRLLFPFSLTCVRERSADWRTI